MTFTVEKPVTLVQTRYENIPSVLKYAMFGSGPLTVLGGVEGLGWIPTKFENRSKDWPDIEFHFVSGCLACMFHSACARKILKSPGNKKKLVK